MALWYKLGQEPGPLPGFAISEDGSVWSHLDQNPEGIEACGLIEAPPIPSHDPATQEVKWNGTDGWDVITLPAASVTRLQAKEVLRRHGLLTAVTSFVNSADDDGELALWWADAPDFHRTSPLFAKVAAGLGITEAQIDAMWAEAQAI
jgi:hypothetical protein